MNLQNSFRPFVINTSDTITISGVVFHVEDCCRQLLKDYLSGLGEAKLQEERLAEILLEELKEEGKQIVSKSEVDQMIQKTKHLHMPD